MRGTIVRAAVVSMTAHAYCTCAHIVDKSTRGEKIIRVPLRWVVGQISLASNASALTDTMYCGGRRKPKLRPGNSHVKLYLALPVQLVVHKGGILHSLTYFPRTTI